MSTTPTHLACIVLAAGQGTRMKSRRPKVLHEIGGVPLVEYPVSLALDLGAHPIVVVVGHEAESVKSALEARFPGNLTFVLQEMQKGTGHAVMQAMSALAKFDGRVLILSGDVPLLKKDTVLRLLEAQHAHAQPLAAVTMRLDDPKGYGRMVRDLSGNVVRIVEHKDASKSEHDIQEVNAGIYVMNAAFLRDGLQRLTDTNAQKEYYLTDLVAMAAGEGRGVATVELHDPTEALGINNRAELARLDAILRASILERWMTEGVTVVDPKHTYVGPFVTLENDVTLHPNVHLTGRTSVRRDTVIETGCVVTDAVIHERVRLRPYSIVESATVRTGAIVGPFARIRPESDVMEDAHVGNFVELKKTRLGRGAKANHLAYLGDAMIGEGANIGAGTITCNYDGVGKYITEVGDRVFVGSNATLVAPIAIGSDAYIAAGSTLTDNVDADSLVFGRARQVQKPGRAKALREDAKKRAAEQKKKAKKD